MINAIELFSEKYLEHPDKMAIADIKHGHFSFKEIYHAAGFIQQSLNKYHIRPGDSVVLAIPPSPEMYSCICSLMASGIKIILIEPWLKLKKIDHIIKNEKPKAFISKGLGKLWGLRLKSIRKIPIWISPKMGNQTTSTPLHISLFDPQHIAFVVFTSGSSGSPKGIIRTHQYLKTIFNIFIEIEPEIHPQPDLAIFPNLALFHLATGRGALIAPSKWSKRNFEKLKKLIKTFQPATLSCGPAFLAKIFELNIQQEMHSLKRIVIGGALSDCSLIDQTIKHFKEAKIYHIYGGSEAEPLTLIDAREALEMSLKKNYFQLLCLGRPIPHIAYQLLDGILWVSGPNVSPEYIGDQQNNENIKIRDHKNTLWHNMGDRIKLEDGCFWFHGRSFQCEEDFLLEQKIYWLTQSSKSFVVRDQGEQLFLYGENLQNYIVLIKKHFPEIKKIINTKIIRDRRHRSRIDRIATLSKTKGYHV